MDVVIYLPSPEFSCPANPPAVAGRITIPSWLPRLRISGLLCENSAERTRSTTRLTGGESANAYSLVDSALLFVWPFNTGSSYVGEDVSLTLTSPSWGNRNPCIHKSENPLSSSFLILFPLDHTRHSPSLPAQPQLISSLPLSSFQSLPLSSLRFSSFHPELFPFFSAPTSPTSSLFLFVLYAREN